MTSEGLWVKDVGGVSSLRSCCFRAAERRGARGSACGLSSKQTRKCDALFHDR